MANNDWYEAGEEIRNLVQDAVERQDFSQLSTTITNVVNQTVDGFQNALKESLSGTGQDESRKPYQDAANRIKREMENKQRQSGQRQTGQGQSGQRQSGQPYTERRYPAQPSPKQELRAVRPKKLKVPGQVTGTVMAWTGYSLGSMFGLALAILGVIGYTTGAELSTVYGILGVLFGGSLWVGIKGSRRLGLAGRFRRYVGLLKERTYCTIEELASGTGKSIGFVKKDLKKMIRRGFFPEGHLDRRETCLITDHDTYQQYLLTQQEYDRKTEKDKWETGPEQKSGRAEDMEKTSGPKASESSEPGEKLTGECRALLDEGNRYIRHIHECNDRIPGEEISAKLDRLELVVTRIFREVERRPELAPELRKMMNYYLPTTQKLLDAYCNLDAQTIRGQNIETTKREIEDALDTINTAFENLLDSFFENTAWDISSDISVLHTMFAQEGLTGKDFE